MSHKLLYPYYLFTSKVDHFYHFFQIDNLFGNHSSFINFGYWPASADYDSAAKHLALALGDYAQLNPQQTVVAVGCGFGDELALWKAHYQLDSVVGININFCQLEVAKGLERKEAVSFCQADARSLTFRSDSIDRILALESAFHFNSREKFFHEAHDALKPGGILSLADIILTDEKFNFLQRGILTIVYRIFKIPSANRQTWSAYHDSLQRAGFEHIEKKDVSRQVFMGFFIYLIKKNSIKSKMVKFVLILLKFIFSNKFTFSYILVRASKPASAS